MAMEHFDEKIVPSLTAKLAAAAGDEDELGGSGGGVGGSTTVALAVAASVLHPGKHAAAAGRYLGLSGMAPPFPSSPFSSSHFYTTNRFYHSNAGLLSALQKCIFFRQTPVAGFFAVPVAAVSRGISFHQRGVRCLSPFLDGPCRQTPPHREADAVDGEKNQEDRGGEREANQGAEAGVE